MNRKEIEQLVAAELKKVEKAIVDLIEEKVSDAELELANAIRGHLPVAKHGRAIEPISDTGINKDFKSPSKPKRKKKRVRRPFGPRRVRAIRAAMDMNQIEFAEAVGVSKGCISHWEKGIHVPTPEHIEKLKELESELEG